MKEYFLKYEVDDEGGDYEVNRKVDYPSDNIYDFPELEIGGPMKLVEVDTETKEEKVIERFLFVDMEKSLEEFGDQVDEQGYRKYHVYVSCDTLIFGGCRVKEGAFHIVDRSEYWRSYSGMHIRCVEERAQKLAEEAKKAEEEKNPTKKADEPSDEDGSEPGSEE